MSMSFWKFDYRWICKCTELLIKTKVLIHYMERLSPRPTFPFMGFARLSSVSILDIYLLNDGYGCFKWHFKNVYRMPSYSRWELMPWEIPNAQCIHCTWPREKSFTPFTLWATSFQVIFADFNRITIKCTFRLPKSNTLHDTHIYMYLFLKPKVSSVYSPT